MAKAAAILICISIIVIDVVAGVLGIEAENAQNKGKHLRVFFVECKEPVHQAYQLGLAAAILLGISHLIVIILGGCICICSRDEFTTSSISKRIASIVLLVSWIILGVGFTMLIVGAMSNRKSRVSCGLDQHNFLSKGGILCFVHGFLCVVYYVTATGAYEVEGKVSRNTGI